MPTSDTAWKLDAACRGKSDLFLANNEQLYSRHKVSKFDRMITEKSKAVCSTCPVRITCLEWALSQRIPYYVYGGLSWPERLAVLKNRRILVDSPDDAMIG